MSVDLRAVAERVDSRLTASPWDLSVLDDSEADVSAAAEVALFAVGVAGQRRIARRAGRFSRLVVGFALAACLALASIACEKPDASPEATAQAISTLASESGSSVTVAANPRASPAKFTDLVLLDAGSDQQPWAVVAPSGGNAVPILVDRVGSGLDSVGEGYELAAQPVTVGTRDGPSQFLDPLQPATSTGAKDVSALNAGQLTQQWAQDERYLAVTRAIAGTPTVLDAAYNAEAAANAGGTHSYVNGVVLRVEPDSPVIQVIDRALLESGRPTRAEDIVYVAVRSDQMSLYAPGQVVNLRDVVMDRQQTDVNGQPTTVYVANAALDGSRVEPTGASVNLEQLLQPRLQRVDQDLAAQQQVAATGTPQPTAAAGTPTSAGQPIIINNTGGYRGPSFVDDFLIWMWLSNSGFYSRGPTVIVNNPPPSPYRTGGGDVYYSAPPAPSGAVPSTVASSQAASRSTALEAARTSVSGQSSGTGGGVAATNKSAADATARVGAATSKSAAAAGAVAIASSGKSTSSVTSSSSGTAARSAGSTSAGTRGSAGVSSSSSSGSKAIGGSSGGFGGKGISGGGSSSSS